LYEFKNNKKRSMDGQYMLSENIAQQKQQNE